MEHGLGVKSDEISFNVTSVLILVLMEHGLGVMVQVSILRVQLS